MTNAQTTANIVDYHDAVSLLVHTYPTAQRLSAEASDLVFNHDWSNCRVDTAQGSMWDLKALNDEAEHVAYCISAIGEACDRLTVLSDLFGRM